MPRIAAAAAALRENDPVAARQYLATAPAEFRHWGAIGLEARVTGGLASQMPSGDAAQLVVDQWQQLVKRPPVAGADRRENSGDLAGVRFLFVLHESASAVQAVCSARFSTNGSRLLTTTADGTCVWWNTESWKRVEQVRVADHILYATANSPDGELVAFASGGRTVNIVDAALEPLRQLRGHVLSVCFDPSGSRIASSSRARG